MFENLEEYKKRENTSSPGIVKTLGEGVDTDTDIDLLTLFTYINYKERNVFAFANWYYTRTSVMLVFFLFWSTC